MGKQEKNKYLTILDALSEEEKERFREFIFSPYFNKRPQLHQLYDLVEKQLKDGGLNRQALWEDLFPEKKWPKSKKAQNTAHSHVRKLLSDLAQLADRFLVVEKIENEEWSRAKVLLQAYQDHEIENWYRNTKRKLEKGIAAHPAHPERRYELKKLDYFYETMKGRRPGWDSLLDLVDSLESYYAFDRIRYVCEGITLNIVLNKPKPLPDPPIIENREEITDLYFRTYHLHQSEMGSEKEKSLFEGLRLDLEKRNPFKYKQTPETTFAPQDLFDLYNQLQNLCSDRFQQQGKLYYLDWSHQLNLDLMPMQEEIAPINFKNSIFIALKLDRPEDAELILEAHLHKVESSHRDQLRAYGMAKIAFHREDWQGCRKALRDLNFEHPFYGADGRTLEWQSWVKSGDYEFALQKIANNRRFLERESRIPGSRKKPMLLRLKFAKRIIEGRIPPATLQQEIKEARVPSKGFLLEMLTQITKDI